MGDKFLLAVISPSRFCIFYSIPQGRVANTSARISLAAGSSMALLLTLYRLGSIGLACDR